MAPPPRIVEKGLASDNVVIDIELVEKREAAGEFEAEAEGEDEVPDGQAAGLNEPHSAVRGVGEKLVEGAARTWLPVVERIFGVKGPHEGESGLDSVRGKREEGRCIITQLTNDNGVFAAFWTYNRAAGNSSMTYTLRDGKVSGIAKPGVFVLGNRQNHGGIPEIVKVTTETNRCRYSPACNWSK
jgi:hypothetical protein